MPIVTRAARTVPNRRNRAPGAQAQQRTLSFALDAIGLRGRHCLAPLNTALVASGHSQDSTSQQSPSHGCTAARVIMYHARREHTRSRRPRIAAKRTSLVKYLSNEVLMCLLMNSPAARACARPVQHQRVPRTARPYQCEQKQPYQRW